MKILVIANLYPSEKDPTYGTFVKNFTDALSSKDGVSIKLCVIRGRTNNPIKKLVKYLCFLSTALFYLVFSKYDIVYNHIITHAAIPLRIVSLFKNIPIVFNIHGEDLLTKTKISKYGLKIVTPLLYKAKLIVVPSLFFKRKVMEFFPDINSELVYVSASGGISKTFFCNENVLKSQSGVTKIGYVSRIDRGKGWKVFVDAISCLQDNGINIQGYLAGTGAQVLDLKEYLKKNGKSKIKYVGAVPYSELPKFYSKIDLFVFPTMLEESLGLVGLEAMASSVPVIASQIGGITDYLSDGRNGYFFAKGNYKDLANCILKYILADENVKKQLKNTAFSTAKNYESDLIMDRLYQKLLLLN